MFDISKMKARVMDIADPNNPYTQEDFNKEFGRDTFTTPLDSGDLHKLNISFVNNSNNPDPDYATNGSSGFDLRANLEESMVIGPSDYKLVKTGLYFEIPKNMEITVRSRSGLAYKYGVSVLNGVGTIDSDYKGEIGVLLINHGKKFFVINHGDRIAQGVLSSVIGKDLIKFNKVDKISEDSERGSGGFGSTGLS
jgi:dUTP pyrophosphatase